jgi:hypothetical protein
VHKPDESARKLSQSHRLELGQTRPGRKPNGVFQSLFFQGLVDLRFGKRVIGPKHHFLTLVPAGTRRRRALLRLRWKTYTNPNAFLFEATQLMFRSNPIFRGTSIGVPGAEDHQLFAFLNCSHSLLNSN